jgi:hypothetical protein
VQTAHHVEDNVLLSVDDQTRAVTARFRGPITALDLRRVRERMVELQAPGYAQILDFTGVTSLNLTTAEIRATAQAARANQCAQHFIVAKLGAVSIGLARMIQAYAGCANLHVIESI